YIKLPSARKLDNCRYAPRSLPIETDQLLKLRAILLREAALQFEPDLLLVDKSPGGLMGELQNVLDLMRDRHPRARLVLGLRDILDQPETVISEWSSRDLIRLVERHYDEIWIYGDAAVFDAAATYRWPDSLRSRTRYLGYLVPSISAP